MCVCHMVGFYTTRTAKYYFTERDGTGRYKAYALTKVEELLSRSLGGKGRGTRGGASLHSDIHNMASTSESRSYLHIEHCIGVYCRL